MSPISGILFLFFSIIVLPIGIAIYQGNNTNEVLGLFLILAFGTLVVLDLLFRFLYRLRYGRPFLNAPRVSVDKLFVEPHPFLSFINKKKFLITSTSYGYPLHKDKYTIGNYYTNNLRFSNGEDGSRDIQIPKPEGLIRINCIGASTTGNYIEYQGSSYSYPLELEKKLNTNFGESIEVNNCGQGGYNSLDVLIRLLLQVLDTDPDIILLYHAYNDINAYLTDDFSSDYSHSRRNLGESYWKFAIASKIPTTPFKFINFLIEKWMPVDSRNSLLGQIAKGKFNIQNDPSKGLIYYKRNLQYIIDICKARNIELILSTYCHLLYDGIKNDALHQVYRRIVSQENDIMRELAKKNNLTLVDNAALVPQEEEYFVDSIHFTPIGMQTLAANFEKPLKEIISKRIKLNKERQ